MRVDMRGSGRVNRWKCAYQLPYKCRAVQMRVSALVCVYPCLTENICTVYVSVPMNM